MTEGDDRRVQLVDEIAALAGSRGRTIGVAESLTGGQIAAALASGENAAAWFRGSVVAYAAGVKFDVLGVEPGPVNTATCAQQMALGVSRLLDCEIAVSATGVGGPGPDEGVPAGTVFIACSAPDAEVVVEEHQLTGDPGTVVEHAVERALATVLRALRG